MLRKPLNIHMRMDRETVDQIDDLCEIIGVLENRKRLNRTQLVEKLISEEYERKAKQISDLLD